MVMVKLILILISRLVRRILIIVIMNGMNCLLFWVYIFLNKEGFVSLNFMMIRMVVRFVKGIILRMVGMVKIFISKKILWIKVVVFVLLFDWMLVELCMIIWVIGKLLIKLLMKLLIFWVFNFWLVGVRCL